jgi:hypothetical protein
MQEFDEQPTDVEDELTACHDCEGYREMLDSLNQKIARLRNFVASPEGFSSLEDALRDETPESHREELKDLEARLRGLTLGHLAHQRQAH